MTKLLNLTLYILITALILSMPCFCLPSSAKAQASVVGVWVSTVANLDFPSKKGLDEKTLKSELDSIVSVCKQRKINTIYFQVRPKSDALYKSDIFPWSDVISGTQGVTPDNGFDPLEYIISASKKNNISVHAWINPYRVCKADELDSLSDKNPAVVHPEYTVLCSDGNVYYNPALEKVRKLITDGVVEILKKYDVDGIHFDDYFYPYNVTDYPDEEDYKKYGKEFDNVADFRRNNINMLVKEVYTAVHKNSKNAVFGISPFGIWDNKRDNPDGSDTKGMSSYSQIYADSRLWVQKGWVDYICPQVYWSFENTAAPFETVVRWWDSLCKKSKVKLYIGHGIYKLGEAETGWDSALQVKRQLELCESLSSVDGNVFFRYKTVAQNTLGVADILSEIKVKTPVIEKIEVPQTPAVKFKDISITSVQNGYTTRASTCSVSGVTDPSLPLTANGTSVNVTQNGYFSAHCSLKIGKNNFTFSNGNQSKTITINRIEQPKTLPECFYADSAFPVGECVFSPLETVSLQISALSGLTVFAKVGDEQIALSETKKDDVCSVYTADISMPNILFCDIPFGKISFYALKDGVRFDYPESADVVVGALPKVLYTVSECYWYDSFFGGSMMDNYQLPSASVVTPTALVSDMYKTSCGKWISKDNLSDKKVSSVLDVDTDNYHKITISANSTFECYSSVDDCCNLILDILGTSDVSVDTSSNVSCISIKNSNSIKLVLKNGSSPITGFYCQRKDDKTLDVYVYVKSGILSGKTIAIDAGHGGSDSGALGPVGENGASEADLNLSMSLLLAKELAAEGAKIYFTRSDDSAVLLDKRAGLIRSSQPDISISVHHNSLDLSSDFNKATGAIVFYSRQTSLPLVKQLSKTLGCEYRKQSLNVCRDYRYPCVLIECGYVCNPCEYELLLTDEYKQQLCDKIVLSICDYFSKKQLN